MSTALQIHDLSTLEASTAQLPLVGYTVFWRLAGLRVTHAALAQALQHAGFAPYLPDPPTPRVALRRALAAWLRTQQLTRQAARRAAPATLPVLAEPEDEGQRRTLIRVINRAGDAHLVFALVAEDVDFPVLGLHYGTALRILLHKQTGAMICTTAAEGEIAAQRESQHVAAALQPYWEQYRTLHLADDLAQLLRGILGGLQAVPLRQAGGVYFVSRTCQEPLERLRELLSGLPHDPEQAPFLCALGVPDVRETRRSLGRAVHAGLLDELKGLERDLAELQQQAGQVRAQTVTQRLLTYRRMKEKANLYRELLACQQGEIQGALGVLETAAQQLLTRAEQTPVRAGAVQAAPRMRTAPPDALASGFR
jgi:hypothetical protein